MSAIGSVRFDGLGFNLPGEQLAISAAGSILAYLEENEPAAIGRIKTLSAWRSGSRMEIDEATRRSLEIVRGLPGWAESRWFIGWCLWENTFSYGQSAAR